MEALKEYMFLLKPAIDMSSYNDAFKELEDSLHKKSQDLQNEIDTTKDVFSEEEKKKKIQESKTLDTMGNIVGGFNEAYAVVSQLVTVFKEALDEAEKVLDKAGDVSNQFVTGSSAFINTDVKNKMLTYGVSSTEAQSIIAAESALGISASDYATLTEGQRDAFERLMQHYQEGLDSLDTDKLDEYNETMQEYQLKMAEFNMDIKLAFMELFTNSEPLKDLADTVMDFFESIVDILSSDTAQFVFDSFVTFLTTIIDVLSMPVKLFSGILGSGSTTNNYNSNTTNNTYIGKGESTTSNLNVDLSYQSPQS